jgi:ligand-binding SRPBCC domain-containing protein
MKLKLSTRLNCATKTAWQYVLMPELLEYIAHPLVNFESVDTPHFPERWTEGDYKSRLSLFGFVPFGEQIIGIRIDEARQKENTFYELLDDGHSKLIPTWRHRITLEANEGQTLYTDELELRAGLLTPFVWLFAFIFYHHRQRRWRKLIAQNFALLKSDAHQTGFEQNVKF